MRLWLPYADPAREVLLHINFWTSDRRYVWVSGQGRVASAAAAPTLWDSLGHGAYYEDAVSC